MFGGGGSSSLSLFCFPFQGGGVSFLSLGFCLPSKKYILMSVWKTPLSLLSLVSLSSFIFLRTRGAPQKRRRRRREGRGEDKDKDVDDDGDETDQDDDDDFDDFDDDFDDDE